MKKVRVTTREKDVYEINLRSTDKEKQAPGVDIVSSPVAFNPMKGGPSLKKKHTSHHPFFVSLLNYERYATEVQWSHSSLLCNCYHCYFPQKKRSVMLFYHERQNRRKNKRHKTAITQKPVAEVKIVYFSCISRKFIYYLKLLFYTKHDSFLRSILDSINICRDKQKLFLMILSLRLETLVFAL